jgi:Domain of unknown function (DU1801)
MAAILPEDIHEYNAQLLHEDAAICTLLAKHIITQLPEATSKVRHGHPVWFLQDNPVVGYSKQKKGICLLFRSGQSFDEDGLHPEGKFKAAQAVYNDASQIDGAALTRWLEKAKTIQWDYKNIVIRKGVLERLV